MSRKTLTPEQIKMVEGMAAMRMPSDKIAVILGVSKDTFERMMKRDKELGAAVERGRARGTQKAYSTAFQVATGYTRTYEVDWFNPKTGRWEKRSKTEDVPPDVNMLRFWLKTQEGWRETDRLEITGAGGGAIKVDEMTPAARREKIEHYLKLREKLEAARKLIAAARDVTPAEGDQEPEPLADMGLEDSEDE